MKSNNKQHRQTICPFIFTACTCLIKTMINHVQPSGVRFLFFARSQGSTNYTSGLECFCPGNMVPLTSRVHSRHSKDHRGWIGRHHTKSSFILEKNIRHRGRCDLWLPSPNMLSLPRTRALYMLAQEEPVKTRQKIRNAGLKRWICVGGCKTEAGDVGGGPGLLCVRSDQKTFPLQFK